MTYFCVPGPLKTKNKRGPGAEATVIMHGGGARFYDLLDSVIMHGGAWRRICTIKILSQIWGGSAWKKALFTNKLLMWYMRVCDGCEGL